MLFLISFILIEFILLLFNSSLWIRLQTPASALLTVPKLIYPNVANKAVVVYVALIGIITVIIAVNHYKRFSHSFFVKSVTIIFLTTIVLSLASSISYIGIISNVKTEYTSSAPKAKLEAVKAASSQQKHICIDLSQNFTGHKPVTFKLYLPDSGKEPRDVVMYLAYGNWLAINEKNVDYLVDDLTQNEYGAVVFTGKTRLDTDIVGMVQDIREKIVYLKKHASEYGIRHIYLSGGSAGANLALLTAYAYRCPDYSSDGLTADQVRTDGVIAFYPVVDMLYNYHYFTDKTKSEETALDKLGDAFFSLSDVNGAKSISDSQKIVTKTLLGGGPNEGNLRHLYEISSPNRFLSRDIPPTFLIQGSDDSMTPFAPTKEMYESLKKLDVDAAMLELPHTDHAFDMVLPDSSVVTSKVLNCINEWLDRHQS